MSIVIGTGFNVTSGELLDKKQKVATFADLETQNCSVGQLCFVADESVVYVKTNSGWQAIVGSGNTAEQTINVRKVAEYIDLDTAEMLACTAGELCFVEEGNALFVRSSDNWIELAKDDCVRAELEELAVEMQDFIQAGIESIEEYSNTITDYGQRIASLEENGTGSGSATPAAHQHTTADITDLDLTTKADADHTHDDLDTRIENLEIGQISSSVEYELAIGNSQNSSASSSNNNTTYINLIARNPNLMLATIANLNDTRGRIKVTGKNGIEVSSSGNSLSLDTANLQTQISSLQGVSATVQGLQTTVGDLQDQVNYIDSFRYDVDYPRCSVRMDFSETDLGDALVSGGNEVFPCWCFPDYWAEVGEEPIRNVWNEMLYSDDVYSFLVNLIRVTRGGDTISPMFNICAITSYSACPNYGGIHTSNVKSKKIDCLFRGDYDVSGLSMVIVEFDDFNIYFTCEQSGGYGDVEIINTLIGNGKPSYVDLKDYLENL